MRKIISVILSFGLLFQQSGLLYAAGEINLANYLSQAKSAMIQPDVFQPARLRYISYDIKSNDFKLLLDKGNPKLSNSLNSLNPITPKLNPATQELFNYFLIGLALPNDTFWVNLRPDAPDNIIDSLLEKTDIGKIFLEADLQLKKDTASLTSPQNPEGKAYWDKLYKKAGELFGTENITIPTITRPWIVPNEVIVRETEDSAYIYKATLKVMLEEDYLRGMKDDPAGASGRGTIDYSFNDPRLKELNEYSTQLIRETIIPKLTKELNSSKRYAQLRQVYYSLVLSRWFKQKYSGFKSTRAQGTSASVNNYMGLIDSGNLTSNLQPLTSQQPYSKESYFQAYQKSFKDGEYNLQETVATPFGQSIRSYISGGIRVVGSPIGFTTTNTNKQVTDVLTGHRPAIVASPLTQQEAIGILNNLIPEKGDQLMLSEQTRQVMFETLINILLLTDKREELYDNTYHVIINFMNGITNGKSVMKDIFASFGSELQKLKALNEPFEKKNVDKLFSVIGKLLLDNLKKSLPGEGTPINEKLIKLVQAKQSQPYFGLEQLEAVKYKDMLSAQLEALINELREHLSRYEKDYKFADDIRDELLLSMGYINGEINKLRDTYYNEFGKLLNDIINTLSKHREKYDRERELSQKITYIVGDWWDKESTDKHNNNRDNRINFYVGLVDIFWNNEKSFEKIAGYIKMIIDAKKVAKSSAAPPLTPDESVNYVEEARGKLTNFYQWDSKKSSDATLDDLIEAAKKAGESKLKPNAMELTSEAVEWYGLAEKLAEIKSEWSVYAGSPLTLKQGQGLFLGLINEINSMLMPQGVSYSGVDEKITLAKNLESLLELIPGVSIQLDSFIDNAPGNAKIGLQEIREKFKNFIKLVSTAGSPLNAEQFYWKLRTTFENKEFFQDGEKAFIDLIDIFSQVDQKAELESRGVELFINPIVLQIIKRHKELVAHLEPVMSSLHSISHQFSKNMADYDVEGNIIIKIEKVLDAIAETLKVNQDERKYSIPADKRDGFSAINDKFISAVKQAQKKISQQKQSPAGSPLTQAINDLYAKLVPYKNDAIVFGRSMKSAAIDDSMGKLLDQALSSSDFLLDANTNEFKKLKIIFQLAAKYDDSKYKGVSSYASYLISNIKPYQPNKNIEEFILNVFQGYVDLLISNSAQETLKFRESASIAGVSTTYYDLNALKEEFPDDNGLVVISNHYEKMKKDNPFVWFSYMSEAIKKLDFVAFKGILQEFFPGSKDIIRFDGLPPVDVIQMVSENLLKCILLISDDSRTNINEWSNNIKRLFTLASSKRYKKHSLYSEIVNFMSEESSITESELQDEVKKGIANYIDEVILRFESLNYTSVLNEIHLKYKDSKERSILKNVPGLKESDITVKEYSLEILIEMASLAKKIALADRAANKMALEVFQFLKECTSSSSLTVAIVPEVKRGGIDFTDRAMRIKLERVGSFASSALVLPEIANVEALDLDKEFEHIQAMVSSSIRPSDTRILEFAAACYYKGEFDRRLTQVSSCIKEAHLADELWGRESSPALRLATMLPDALYGG